MAARAAMSAPVAATVRPDPERLALAARAAERDVSWTFLSALIGRNPAYIQQYLTRGSPQRLDELDRRHLAIYLEMDERALGALTDRSSLAAVDRDALVLTVAEDLWSRLPDGRSFGEAGDYWRDQYRDIAAAAIASVERRAGIAFGPASPAG